MIKFATPTKALKPKTKDSEKIAYFYAGLLVIIVLCQLFTFDEFLKLIVSFNLPGGEVMANFIGSLIVVSEVFALPFLLRIDLSPLMRIVSMVFSWVAAASWLKLSIWLIISDNLTSNFGLLGTLVHLSVGWWAVFFCLAMCVMAVWSSWGLWPISKSFKK